MAPSPFEDEHTPLFTVGQVADMLAVKQAFLRRVDDGPADVIDYLQTLDTFVARVNRFARSFSQESLG